MQRPEDQNNLFLAVILSMAVLFAWQYFIAAPISASTSASCSSRRSSRPSRTGRQAPPSAGSLRADLRPLSATPAAASNALDDRGMPPSRAPRLAIDTPVPARVDFAQGRPDRRSHAPKRYHETIDKKSPNVVLFSPLDAPMAYFAEFGWQGANPQDVPNSDTVWTAASPGPLSTPPSPSR